MDQFGGGYNAGGGGYGGAGGGGWQPGRGAGRGQPMFSPIQTGAAAGGGNAAQQQEDSQLTAGQVGGIYPSQPSGAQAGGGGFGGYGGGGYGGIDGDAAAEHYRAMIAAQAAARNRDEVSNALAAGIPGELDTRSPAERNRDEKQEFSDSLSEYPEFAELQKFIKDNMSEDNIYTVAGLRQHYNQQVEEKYEVFMNGLRGKKDQGQEFTANEKSTARMIALQRQYRQGTNADLIPVTSIIKQVREMNAT